MAHTLLAIAVPEVESLVRGLRRRFEPEWEPPDAEHVQAHVTLLSPFVPVAECDAGIHDRLVTLFAHVRPFEYRLAEVRSFPDDVVYLAPDPADTFRDLTRALVAEFPGFEPYAGRFASLIPHMTVGPIWSAEMERELATAAADALPVDAVAREARLIFNSEGGFDTISVFRLGQPQAV